MAKKIVLDAGHGGKDPGAVGFGLSEKSVVLDIVKRCKSALEKGWSGHTVYLTRASDKFVELGARASFANSRGADVFVSFHNNAATASAHGYEDFVWKKAVASSSGALQKDIRKCVLPVMKKYGIRDRGAKRDNYAVLRLTKMKAILLEIAFITNKKENGLLKSAKFKQDVAKAVAEGIASHLKLKRKSASKPAPKPAPKPPSGKAKYRVQAGAFKDKKNADNRVSALKKKGFEAVAVKEGSVYRVQAGAFADKKNADNRAAAIRKAGIEAVVVAI